MPSTLAEQLRAARATLEAAGIPPAAAAVDADVLARHALGGWERGQLLTRLRDAAPDGFAEAYLPLVVRRARREPAAYIMGSREFWNLDIEVTRDTLVPRPETELIVEEVLARVRGAEIRIADVCTGSGCLAVAIARWLPQARVVGTDVSEPALAVARRNARRHDVEARVTCLRADLLDGIDGRFDAIVANPPYVPSADVTAAMPEVRDYEPRGALDGGTDGLDVVRRLVPQAAARLAPGGLLVMEFGWGQANAVRAVVAAEPQLDFDAIRDDLAGIPRVVVARAVMSESRVPNPESRP